MNKPDPEHRSFMNWLQCLRGFSLLLVLLYHVGNIVDLHLGDPRLVRWFGFGHCGVDIFFVISGFIMFYLHGKEFGQPDKVVVYLKKRAVRIYPIYWLLTTAVLLPALLFSGSVKAYKFAPLNLIESYLLFPIQYSGLPIIPPGWSLFHEVKFYIFFALLIALRAPWHRRWLAGWVIASVATTAWIIATDAPFAHTWHFFWLGPYNLEFLAGCLAGWIAQTHRLSLATARTLLAAGFASLMVAAWWDVMVGISQLARVGAYGFSGLCLVLGCVTLDQHPAAARLAPAWLTRLGDASYSAYLAHYPLLFFMAKIIVAVIGARLAADFAVPLAALLFVASLIGCMVVYTLIERPLVRHSRTWAGLSSAR